MIDESEETKVVVSPKVVKEINELVSELDSTEMEND